MRVCSSFAAFALCLALSGPAVADDIFVTFEGRDGSQNMGPIKTDDTMTIVGLIKRPDGAINHTVALKAVTSSLTVNVSWRSGATGEAFRLIGVNLDLVDASNTVVASDSFQGVLNGFATSTMSAAVTSGSVYRFRMTGTSIGVGTYTIVIAPG